jgi:hypothetical protein
MVRTGHIFGGHAQASIRLCRLAGENSRRLSRASALGFLMAALLGASFAVAGQRTHKPSAPAVSGVVASPLTPISVIEKIPSGASSGDGQPGDFVNFLIVGTEADMKLTFQGAGWRAVDRTKAAAPSPASQEEYLAMPLREQSLFSKPQDYGFAYPALVTVVQARHDVRIWKAPFVVNGQALWVGAASHEGPWWDNGTEAVSDAAFPNMDDERDFLAQSLQATGLVERSEYVTSEGEPGNPRPEASHGLLTDGRILVMTLIHLSGR